VTALLKNQTVDLWKTPVHFIAALGSVLAIKHAISETGCMARFLRIELAGDVYHVTSRGDHRENIETDWILG
jgi:hypothetical protein